MWLVGAHVGSSRPRVARFGALERRFGELADWRLDTAVYADGYAG